MTEICRRAGDPKRDAITARFKEFQAIEHGEAPPEPEESDDAVIAAAAAEKPEDDDPELELLVYGNVIRRKRSELIDAYDLEGFDNGRIINIARKQMAADQRLAEAKEAADQRLHGTASTAPRAGEGSPDAPTDQSDEPRPDDADGLAPERDPPHEARPGFDEEKLDEIVQRVEFDEAKRPIASATLVDAPISRHRCARARSGRPLCGLTQIKPHQ